MSACMDFGKMASKVLLHLQVVANDHLVFPCLCSPVLALMVGILPNSRVRKQT